MINMYHLLLSCLHLSYRQPQFKSVSLSTSQGDGNLSNPNVTNYVISGITSLFIYFQSSFTALLGHNCFFVIITAAAFTNSSLLAPTVPTKLTAVTYAFTFHGAIYTDSLLAAKPFSNLCFPIHPACNPLVCSSPRFFCTWCFRTE